MRNIFDQYTQPENKLTHSLVSSLAQDPALLRKFLSWAVRKRFPRKHKIYIIEQSLPGQDESDEKEAAKRGLPDACIFDDDGWILIIESKVASRLTVNQLERHHDTVARRGYKDPRVLAITTEDGFDALPRYVSTRTWREVYEWGCRQAGTSPWPGIFTQYFENLEAKMVQDEYLKAGTLTKFSGIPFDADTPYNYVEAKRLLKLLIDEFKADKRFLKEIGIDPALPGRGSIKGRSGTVVWDFLQFKEARGVATFTKCPHMTFDISFKAGGLKVTLPHGMDRKIRDRIFKLPYEEFEKMCSRINKNMKRVVSLDPTVKPLIKVLQRHYVSQSAPPTTDAELYFDLRTAFEPSTGPQKYQPQWLRTVYDAMRNKKSNMQMQVGVEIPLGTSNIVRSEKLVKVFHEAARALLPVCRVVFAR